jgi:ParB-like chromosome segregation protein Spo0J
MALKPIPIKNIKIPHHRLYSRLNGLGYEGFQASMEADGQLEPIIVFQGADGVLWLGDGAHRLKEAQNKAEKFPQETPQTVEAIVKPGSEEDAVIFSVRANVHRGKLDPANLAKTLDYFYHKGWNIPMLCHEFHLSKGYVDKLLRIVDADPRILGQLERGEITSDEAYRAARVGMPNADKERRRCAYCDDYIRPDNLRWKPYHGECALKVSILIKRDQMSIKKKVSSGNPTDSESSADDKGNHLNGGDKQGETEKDE